MARANLVTQEASAVGADLTWTAPDAVDGAVCDVGRGLVLLVRNLSAGNVTVTLQTPASVEGLAVAENAFVSNANDISAFKLDNSVYGRPVGGADAGRAYVDFSAVASVTCAVVKAL